MFLWIFELLWCFDCGCIGILALNMIALHSDSRFALLWCLVSLVLAFPVPRLHWQWSAGYLWSHTDDNKQGPFFFFFLRCCHVYSITGTCAVQTCHVTLTEQVAVTEDVRNLWVHCTSRKPWGWFDDQPKLHLARLPQEEDKDSSLEDPSENEGGLVTEGNQNCFLISQKT